MKQKSMIMHDCNIYLESVAHSISTPALVISLDREEQLATCVSFKSTDNILQPSKPMARYGPGDIGGQKKTEASASKIFCRFKGIEGN